MAVRPLTTLLGLARRTVSLSSSSPLSYTSTEMPEVKELCPEVTTHDDLHRCLVLIVTALYVCSLIIGSC